MSRSLRESWGRQDEARGKWSIDFSAGIVDGGVVASVGWGNATRCQRRRPNERRKKIADCDCACAYGKPGDFQEGQMALSNVVWVHATDI